MIDISVQSIVNNATIYFGNNYTVNSSLLAALPPVSNTKLVEQPIHDVELNIGFVKMARVNLSTGIVENLEMVEANNVPSISGYSFVSIPKIKLEPTMEQKAINEILKEIDPNFVVPVIEIEQTIHVGSTKWSQDKGFYE